ncbi:MAG: hypothetical protein ABXS93_04325 [Sulfurimonas sp.]
MKRVKYILASLLVAMLFLTVHDFVVAQIDSVSDTQKEHTLVKTEHKIFHIPVILPSNQNKLIAEFEEQSNFRLQHLVSKHSCNLLLKPPQFS